MADSKTSTLKDAKQRIIESLGSPSSKNREAPATRRAKDTALAKDILRRNRATAKKVAK